MAAPNRKPEILPDLPCACATTRRAARAITQLYDHRLHGAGIEAAQFGLLAILDRMPGTSQTVQGRLLAMDKTTLSRNFKLLKQRGWIEPSPGTDERERGYRLTRAGRERLKAAKPLWKAAQDRLQSIVGPRAWETTLETLRLLTQAAHAAQRAEP
jgi:DNA-binding MarR family transcriptional regulator